MEEKVNYNMNFKIDWYGWMVQEDLLYIIWTCSYADTSVVKNIKDEC